MNIFTPFRLFLILMMVAAIKPAAGLRAEEAVRQLRISVRDEAGDPIPCRIHLWNSDGEPQHADGQPFWNDHFVCDGRVSVELVPGQYRYQIERGPEFERAWGNVTVAKSDGELNVKLPRIANLRRSGWYGGDLHVHRPVDQIELLMRAEDLDFAPVITWWNNRNVWDSLDIPDALTRHFDGHRIYHVMAGEDEREGGALLYFGLSRPLDIKTDNREYPSPMRFVAAARELNSRTWIDIEKPFWWDLPLWLASGEMNSIGIANNHMCRSQMLANEAWGKPRDAQRLPSPRGNGFWTQEIYYHLLNCGLFLPPSAGSASGVLPNPVGYNRVYVNLGDDVPLTRQAWYAGLRRGNCFVTNGPLLVARANGDLPGSRFELAGDRSQSITIELELTSQDPISKLEVIQNGEIAATIDCDESVVQRRKVKIEVSGPGWFLVRAIADVDETFRFASTAPWFVDSSANGPRISRTSAQFFLDWTRERMLRIQANLTDPDRLREVLRPHERAERFWAEKVAAANAP